MWVGGLLSHIYSRSKQYCWAQAPTRARGAHLGQPRPTVRAREVWAVSHTGHVPLVVVSDALRCTALRCVRYAVFIK